MRNDELATVFSNISALLGLKGEAGYMVRSYQNAARSIGHFPGEVAALADDAAKLQEISGVGKEIAAKIQELVATGKLDFYERLQEEFPPGLTTIMAVSGIGPKTAYRFVQELGISTLEELKEALDDGRAATMPRLGAKAVEKIRRNLDSMPATGAVTTLGVALPIAAGLVEALSDLPGLGRLTVAGDVRRGRESVSGIVLVGATDTPTQAIEAFEGIPGLTAVERAGDETAQARTSSGVHVSLHLTDEARSGALLAYHTGSANHLGLLAERARELGFEMSERGLVRDATRESESFDTEEALYARLGMAWIPPELREGTDEVSLAVRHALPTLVDTADIKGDLHLHTEWSDGDSPLESMLDAAAERGYEYIAITDHSAGRGIANGLSVERLHAQRELIDALRPRYPSLTILHGSEVDIRADGTLDYSDEVLGWLDFVVGSIHSAMQQSGEQMTERIVRAMESPFLTVVGHLTTRLIGERAPIDVDVEAIFDAAARTGTALEINASPSRLDLKDSHVYEARERGVPLIVSTDSHTPSNLAAMRLGVGTARRGWCTASDILNTRSWPEFQEFLAAKRGRVGSGARV